MSGAGGDFFQKNLKNSAEDPTQKQWSGGSMHQIHKMYTQKCHNTSSDMHLALLQIRMMPLGLGLPSPAIPTI